MLAHILHRFDMRLAATDMNLGGGNPDLEGERHRLDEFQLVDYIGVARNGPVGTLSLLRRSERLRGLFVLILEGSTIDPKTNSNCSVRNPPDPISSGELRL